ncbi:hybrid sensor histidine kinase/response regulator [Chryseolinea sp. H1M3-3]|uniref:hybrid sensor histidine kinase/response regulator n=1 Tax=Chryseolinea sp. H1M3-3 TaxID=3034144 RepID=UPI0023ED3662|nr:hybrid sensor histidine kinase/response regulator [Chryseolinea sp. H1M3-3]
MKVYRKNIKNLLSISANAVGDNHKAALAAHGCRLHTYVKFLIPVLLQFIALFSNAQQKSFLFDHLTSKDGLSQGNVLDIVEDKFGFIWIGSEDGLNLYNGYSFTVFRNSHKDSTSISNNTVFSIVEDGDGNLWVGTQNGLNFYNRKLNTFQHFKHDPENAFSLSDNVVYAILIDARGNLWVGTSNGLNYYDKSQKQFTRFFHDPLNPNSIANNDIQSIIEDDNKTIWIGTNGGLSKLSPDRKTFKNYKHNSNDPSSLSSDVTRTLFIDRNNTLWVGTFDQGLNCMNEDGTFTHYHSNEDDSTSLSDPFVRSISESKDGELWVATDDGLNLFDSKTKKFRHISPEAKSPMHLNNNSLFSKIIFDKHDRLWVGSRYGRIHTYDKGKSMFKLFQYDKENRSGMNGNSATSFAEDSTGFWVAVDRCGLNYYNRKTEKFTYIVHDRLNKNSPSSNKMLALESDVSGGLWIGYWNTGLDFYDTKTKKFKHFTHDPKDPRSLSDNNVFDVLRDSKGNIWVATFGNGINKYNRSTDDFTRYTHDIKNPNSITGSAIIYLLEDHLGKIWIASRQQGLDMFDPETGIFTHYKSSNKPGALSENAIFSLYEDSENNLWVGTNGGGLNLFDRKTKTFKAFRESDGLPNDAIQGILEDNQKNIWVSTNKGLCRFDYKRNIFKSYNEGNGLQGDHFNRWAFRKLSTGELLFGGNNGFNLFDPATIESNSFVPPVYITDFKLFNKSVRVGANEILKENILLSKEITLSHEQNFFSIEFAALNYRQPEQNQYKYILEGLQNEWVDAGKDRKAYYTNILPGEYTFRVIGSNNDGLWNNEGAVLKIIVTPPFWNTGWFKGIFVLSVVAGAISFYRLRMNAIKSQKIALEQQVKERTSEVVKQKEILETQSKRLQSINKALKSQEAELLLRQKEAEESKKEAEQANQAKSIFLATMSHEIRTPMNGVIGMAELLSETSQTSEQETYTETIKSCGESLLTVINDILDFSKIESGNLELEKNDFNLRTCVEEALDVFGTKASRIGLDLLYEIDPNVPTCISGDVLRLRQVILNLISNAIKFTNKGEIFLGIHLVKGSEQELELAFKIQDTGIGIPANKIDRLFKAFSQVDSSTTRKYGGTGLGLVICEKLVGLMGGSIAVESTLGVGTIFTFTIKTQPGKQIVNVSPNIDDVAGKKILIIDDNSTNRSILKSKLEQWNLRPTLATSGHEALAILSAHADFDLVLTDFQMPEMDGMQVAQRIKAIHPNLPIILLSSIGDEKSKSHPELFTYVLTKPVKHHILQKHVVGQLTGQQNKIARADVTGKKLSTEFATLHPLNILVADDNAVNQTLAERTLNKLGYSITKAINGEEVLKAVSRTSFDVILMDIQMPVMDGLEATVAIRKQKRVQPVIIAMTANAMQGDRDTCLEAGMDDYISKPVKLEILVDVLEKWSQHCQIRKTSPAA